MAGLFKSVMAMNLAIIILQICVLAFGIYRWNEIVGSIFSIVVSFLGYMPKGIGENRERWFLGLSAFLMIADFVFQIVNMILLICFQWVIIQYCIHYNVSVDISEYGGVACNDWWHFGYGEINYRDRALIVTILLAIVIILRLVQIVLTLVSFRSRASKPMFFVSRNHDHRGNVAYIGRRADLATTRA